MHMNEMNREFDDAESIDCIDRSVVSRKMVEHLRVAEVVNGDTEGKPDDFEEFAQ